MQPNNINKDISITVPAPALEVLNKLNEAGYEAYVVGGCVRDSLMGIPPLDWDICSSATPEESLQVFARYHCIKTGLQHGTITVMVDKQAIELTSYRVDGNYSDSRRPDEVTFVRELREDLARRDFTINAMAYNPKEGLIDCFHGQRDLAQKLLRCVGNATERFQEDGLRILRALRFASRFGLNMEPQTAAALRECRELLLKASEERIWKELKGILVGKDPRSMMLNYPEIFCCIMPELEPMVGFVQNNPHHCYDVWEHSALALQAIPAEQNLRLAIFFHDAGKPASYTEDGEGLGSFLGHAAQSAKMAKSIMTRLKSDNACIKTVCKLIDIHSDWYPTTRYDMRRLLGELGEDILRLSFHVRHADIVAQSQLERDEKVDRLQAAGDLLEEVLGMSACFTVKDLDISGKELMELGVKPGPAMRIILEQLLMEVQDERLDNNTEPLQARAATLATC